MKTLAFALITCTWLAMCSWHEAIGKVKDGTDESTSAGVVLLFLFIVTCIVGMTEK